MEIARERERERSKEINITKCKKENKRDFPKSKTKVLLSLSEVEYYKEQYATAVGYHQNQ